jgi:hypothetical protein
MIVFHLQPSLFDDDIFILYGPGDLQPDSQPEVVLLTDLHLLAALYPCCLGHITPAPCW